MIVPQVETVSLSAYNWLSLYHIATTLLHHARCIAEDLPQWLDPLLDASLPRVLSHVGTCASGHCDRKGKLVRWLRPDLVDGYPFQRIRGCFTVTYRGGV